jgi:lysophospholipase L1-like esterase
MDIFVFGNSITQGAFDDECGGWVNRLVAYVYGKDLKSDLKERSAVFNLGVQGEDIRGIRNRFADELHRRVEDGEQGVVILAVGVNDSKVNNVTGKNWTPLETYTRVLQDMIDVAKKEHTVVVAGLLSIDDTHLDPMPWNPEFSYKETEVKKYNESLRGKAEENGCVFVSMQDILENKKELLADGIHPNAEGHRLIFERVKTTLEKKGIL